MADIAIRLEKVGKSFRSMAQPALDDISLQIDAGERVGLIGANGAGKSTLLGIIAGTRSADRGEVIVRGKVHAALTVGIGLEEHLSGRENLYLDAEFQGIPSERIDQTVAEMIEFADLGEHIDRPVRTYSSGMKSRIAFAGLVFADPEILLIDETLSTGDQFFQPKAAAAMRRLCDRGKIVMAVSHSMAAIRSLCNRCIWLRDGRVEMDGAPSEVTSAYSAFQRRRETEMLRSAARRRAETIGETAEARILEISLSRMEGAQYTPSHAAQSGARVRIPLEIRQPVRQPLMTLQIERLDGLSLAKLSAPQDLLENPLPTGSHEISLTFDRFPLAPGHYILTATLYSCERVIAQSVQTIDIHWTAIEYIGGQPVLHVPVSATSQRVSQ